MSLRTLRFKLTWTHGLVISLALVFFGYVRFKTVSYRSMRSFDEGLMSDARFLASRIQPDPNGFRLSLRGLRRGDAVGLEVIRSGMIVTDSDGNIVRPDLHSRLMQGLLEHTGFEEILKQKSGYGQATAADGATYRVVSLPLAGGSNEGLTLHLARSMTGLSGVLDEYLYVYIFSVPLILAVSASIGWYLAGRALKPFGEVARTAEQITSENLNTQIVTKHKEEEIQKLVQSFNSMVKRLHESFQNMRKFNADAAHELRTPLAILQGENEIALRTPNLPEEVSSILESNLEELGRLTRIVNDLLTLAEADAGGQILDRKPTNLGPMLEDLVEQIRVLGVDRGIEIGCVEMQHAVVDADSLWLRRALLNLLDNAIKYSRDGERIEVRMWLRGGLVHVAVCDQGIGIGPSDLPHIFDRLYRADPARTRASGGTGLGLALAKWVVEAHRGEIRVESRLGHGTSFEITLPAVEYGGAETAGNPA